MHQPVRKLLFKLSISLIILTILSTACGVSVSTTNTTGTEQVLQLTQIAIDQQLTEMAPEENSSDASGGSTGAYTLGEEFFNDDGGFSFRGISEFDLEILEGGYTVLSAPDASMDYGPLVTLDSEAYAGSSFEASFQKMLDSFTETYPIQFTEFTDIEVDGWDGKAADFTGTVEGQDVGGSLVYAVVDATDEFLMLGIAPSAQWENLYPVFIEMTFSVSFLNSPSTNIDTDTEAEPLCGNGICGDFEHPGNCPEDCGEPDYTGPLCGDGQCGDFENSGNCPEDCGEPDYTGPLCGDGQCGDFEHPGNCPEDCGEPEYTGPLCGDGQCGDFEHPGNCPEDCGNG